MIVIMIVITYIFVSKNRDRDLNPALPTTTQETELESLRKENAKFRADEKKRKHDNNKKEKDREDKVIADHLAADAIR